MAKNDSLEMAYDAGMAAFGSAQPVAACPFSPIDHPEQRESWLDGYEAGVNQQGDQLAALKEARNA